MKTLEEYLTLPYTIVVRRDADGDFVARVAELRGCVADGPSAKEAVEHLEEVKRLWLEEAIEAGTSIPEPESADDDLPSGRWVQRVPRTLHRSLSQCAAREGVSLNQFVLSVLARAVGRRDQVKRPQPEVDFVDEDSAGALLAYIDTAFVEERDAGHAWEIQQPTWIMHGGTARPSLVESLADIMLTLSARKGKKTEGLTHGKKEREHFFSQHH